MVFGPCQQTSSSNQRLMRVTHIWGMLNMVPRAFPLSHRNVELKDVLSFYYVWYANHAIGAVLLAATSQDFARLSYKGVSVILSAY